MSITGKDLADKIQELIVDRKFRITPELLNETCQHLSVQPFLKWFIENIGPDNILSDEEIRIRKNLQESGAWLTGDELDTALNEAVKDCPELLQLVESNSSIEVDVSRTYEAEREGHDADLKDLNTMENSLKTLQELEIKVDEDIEKEEAALGKLRIAHEKLYHDCIRLVEDMDSAHRELHQRLQHLVQVYTEAAENRGPTIAWTQVPLELFTKQFDTYFNYLLSYIKNEQESNIDIIDSPDNSSSLIDGVNNAVDSAHELMKCQVNLIESKLCEIEKKVWRYGYEALADKAKEIYNDGDLRIPQTEMQTNLEIAELTTKRDLLKENNRLMVDYLKESVEQYANVLITKIIVENGEARLEGKKNRLAKLEHLLHLTQDMGHAPSDLLILLIQMQLQQLKSIISFVADARLLSSTEYTLSSKRSNIMQDMQTKYESITSSSYCHQNIYNKIFSSMVLGRENSTDALELANKKYNDIVAENIKFKFKILNDDLDANLANLKTMKNELMAVYNDEINNGPTRSFKIMPDKIAREFENVMENVENAQNSVSETRKKLKNFMIKCTQRTTDREKAILWQRFLADSEGLKKIYDDAKRIIDRSYFVNSLDN